MTTVQLSPDDSQAESEPQQQGAVIWALSREGVALHPVPDDTLLVVNQAVVRAFEQMGATVVLQLHSLGGVTPASRVVLSESQFADEINLAEGSAAEIPPVVITRAEPRLDLGPGVTVEVSPQADALLREAPPSCIEAILSAIRHWVEIAPVKAARIHAIGEPEEPSWTELAFDLLLDTEDNAKALSWWDELGSALDEANLAVPNAERDWIARNVGVHLHWGADPWDDG